MSQEGQQSLPLCVLCGKQAPRCVQSAWVRTSWTCRSCRLFHFLEHALPIAKTLVNRLDRNGETYFDLSKLLAVVVSYVLAVIGIVVRPQDISENLDFLETKHNPEDEDNDALAEWAFPADRLPTGYPADDAHYDETWCLMLALYTAQKTTSKQTFWYAVDSDEDPAVPDTRDHATRGAHRQQHGERDAHFGTGTVSHASSQQIGGGGAHGPYAHMDAEGNDMV